jgi:hypothetical protein
MLKTWSICGRKVQASYKTCPRKIMYNITTKAAGDRLSNTMRAHILS